MVKRRVHTAILTFLSEPELVNGKRLPPNKATLSVTGRYDADGKTIRKNSNGDEIVIAGNFYMGKIQSIAGKLSRIEIPAFDIDEPIFDIQHWQSHVVIVIANS